MCRRHKSEKEQSRKKKKKEALMTINQACQPPAWNKQAVDANRVEHSTKVMEWRMSCEQQSFKCMESKNVTVKPIPRWHGISKNLRYYEKCTHNVNSSTWLTEANLNMQMKTVNGVRLVGPRVRMKNEKCFEWAIYRGDFQIVAYLWTGEMLKIDD